MNIDKYDSLEIYCRMLGHEVGFNYCRKTSSDIFCSKIRDCWFKRFDIDEYLTTHYPAEKLQEINKPKKHKYLSLFELIEQAKNNGKNK
jgi:hypothetical protein